MMIRNIFVRGNFRHYEDVEHPFLNRLKIVFGAKHSRSGSTIYTYTYTDRVRTFQKHRSRLRVTVYSYARNLGRTKMV